MTTNQQLTFLSGMWLLIVILVAAAGHMEYRDQKAKIKALEDRIVVLQAPAEVWEKYRCGLKGGQR